MLRAWVHSRLDLDKDATFSEWLAENPLLTPLPALVGVAGGPPVSWTEAYRRPAAIQHAVAAANETAVSSHSLTQLAAAAAAAAFRQQGRRRRFGVSDGGHGAIVPYADARCADLSLYRITVTHHEFLKVIGKLQKFVEFRSGNQTEVFFEGMKMIFLGSLTPLHRARLVKLQVWRNFAKLRSSLHCALACMGEDHLLPLLATAVGTVDTHRTFSHVGITAVKESTSIWAVDSDSEKGCRYWHYWASAGLVLSKCQWSYRGVCAIFRNRMSRQAAPMHRPQRAHAKRPDMLFQ